MKISKTWLLALSISVLSACGGGGGGSATGPAIANVAPVANAGTLQNILTASIVTLDGSASSDANSDTLTYRWSLTSKPSGSAASLSLTTSARPTFTADVAGTYVATLIVNDGQVDSASATVTVTATRSNAAPVANAGTAQNVTTSSTVTLDGSASSDANSDTLTYRWSLTSKPSGSAASLSLATSARPTFTADVAGTYVSTLIVNDGQVDSASATVTVTATRSNAAPVANAGASQTAYLGSTVTLDGSASSDANGDTLTYRWTVQSYPGLLAPLLSGPTSVNPTFSSTDAGVYVFSLVVNDGQVPSVASTVTVTLLNSVAPTGASTGLVIQSVSNFWTIDESTLTKKTDFSCGQSMYAIDKKSNGVIVGTNSLSQLYDINPVTGVCLLRGTTPEAMRALAVSPGGQVIGASVNTYSVSGGIGNRIYKLSDTGAYQSYVNLSGDTSFVNAIDFGPDGRLYGLGTTGVNWSLLRIDPDTGLTSTVFVMPTAPTLGDIDIDANGVLRTVISGSLYKINSTTGAVISTTTIPGFTMGSSFGPIVYVP